MGDSLETGGNAGLFHQFFLGGVILTSMWL